jgi:surfeit locus 1 family protein
LRPGLASLLPAALATLVVLGVLVALGSWQLQRKAWKEDLIEKIEARAHGAPASIPPEGEWPAWQAEAHEFRRVSVMGRFLHDREIAVHGLAEVSRGQPAQGFYIYTPLALPEGGAVLVNRGFVPTELRDPSRRSAGQTEGPVTVTGLVRAPERRGWFLPENEPARDRWFSRDPAAFAAARGLARAAPFTIDADSTPNPGGWPKGGQTRLNLPNNHLQYAMTWYGLALTLVGVFAAFARRRLAGRG